MRVLVFNLATAEEVYFDAADPETAVKMAFLFYTRKNRNTWEWPSLFPTLTVTRGQSSVACGDWSALYAR